jgi:MFS family permease
VIWYIQEGGETVNPTITDKMKGRRLDRRQILKGAGVLSAGGIVAALIPTTAHADDEEGKTGYQFLDISDGKGGLTGKSIFMNGVGKIGSGVTGGGNYVIADNALSQAFDFGSWRAEKFVSFTNVGTVVAGFLGATLAMDVILESAKGGEAKATMTVKCDFGVVGTNGGNGSGEVVTLVIKNGTFAGTFGPGSVLPFNVTSFIAPSD